MTAASAVSADTNIDDGNTWDSDNSWSGDDSQGYSDDTNAWDGNDDADNAGTDQWTNENGNTDWGYDNGGDQAIPTMDMLTTAMWTIRRTQIGRGQDN